MSMPSLCSINTLKRKKKKEKEKKERRREQEVSTDPFPVEIQGRPPRTGPGPLPGARTASLLLLLASAPRQLPAHGGLGVVQLLGSCWKAPNNSRGSVTPIDYSLLFTRTRQTRLSSLGLPPLPRSTPDSAASFRMGSRPKPRGYPWPEPPPTCALPCAPSSPGFRGVPELPLGAALGGHRRGWRQRP